MHGCDQTPVVEFVMGPNWSEDNGHKAAKTNKSELTSSRVNRFVLIEHKNHHDRCVELSTHPNHWFPDQNWVPLSIIKVNQNKSQNMTKSVGTKVRHAQSVTGLCPLLFFLYFSDPIFGLQKQHCFGTPTVTKKLSTEKLNRYFDSTSK